jgi:hypothetical protein
MPFRILVIGDHIDDRRKATSRQPALFREAHDEVATSANGGNPYSLVFEYSPFRIKRRLRSGGDHGHRPTRVAAAKAGNRQLHSIGGRRHAVQNPDN